MEKKFKTVIAAGLIVSRVDDGIVKFLMGTRTDNGLLAFPVGHVKEEEDYIYTAIREFQEETGYEISENVKKNIRYIGTSISTYKSRLNRSYIYVLEEREHGQIINNYNSNGELENVKYYDIYELAKLILEEKVFMPSLISLNLIVNYIMDIDPYLIPEDLLFCSDI